MSDTSITVEKKPNLFVRIAVIAGMLLILFFIAGAIVRYVPKIITFANPGKTSDVSMSNESEVATSTNESIASTQAQSGATLTSTPVKSTTPPATQSIAKTNTSVKATAPAKKVASANYNYYANTYRGPADLSISLTKVGQISGASFIQTSSIQPGSRVQVQFLVTNSGGSATGPWSLNAVLPTTIPNQKIYNSISEPSIPAGSSYQMTLAFDAYDGYSNIQITLNSTNDANSGNNILIVPLTSSGYNYNNNCYWSNGYQYCNGNNYNNNNCYWVNGNNTCGNNYNNNYNNGCYYLNGSYVCNNNNNYNNGCYWSGGFQYCNNSNNYNNGCYWSNGYQYCTNNNSYSNNPDLSVVITNVGTMDRYTGQFYYTNGNTFNRNDKVAVQFTVTNIGSNTSGNWTYSANLPSSSNSNSSGTQSPIAPGQTVNFIVGFDYPYSGSQNITVNIYPQNNDSNSSNNYASRTIYVNN